MNAPLRTTTPTMSSVELVDVINEDREPGSAELRHDNFMAKIEKHPGIQSPKFLGDYKDSRGRTYPCYYLPKRECELMVMSESLVVQTKVYDRLAALESGTLPAPVRRPVDLATQALRLAPLAVRAARAFGLDRNAAAISANQYVCAITGQNLLKDFGSTHLLADNQAAQWFTPTELSEQAQLTAQQINKLLADAGFQKKRGKKWELLDAGREFARLFDTGKKHESGVPIQQVKWSPAVIDAAHKAINPSALPGGQQQLGIDSD
jgi:hypothetical protein